MIGLYRLRGALHPAAIGDGFVTPLFASEDRDDGTTYMQVIDRDRIRSFAEVELDDDDMVIQTNSQRQVSVGDRPLHGFQSRERGLLIGNVYFLRDALVAILDGKSVKPAVKRQIEAWRARNEEEPSASRVSSVAVGRPPAKTERPVNDPRSQARLPVYSGRDADFASARGAAANARSCLTNPLAVLSHPLFPAAPDAGSLNSLSLNDFGLLDRGLLNFIRSKRAFAIGGLQLVIDCGLVVEWYHDDATRHDALELIDARGARPLLDALADKDQSHTIFGKNDLRSFFKTFPRVRREIKQDMAARPTSTRQIRLDHPVRLKKALEFLFLTEAVLRYRFRNDETKTRFETITGTKVSSVDSATELWSYMWVDPLIYVCDPAPRDADISRVMNPDLLGMFAERSGQRQEVLYWALRGVPSTYGTAQAAAEVCNQFYGSSAAPTFVVTVPPDRHDARLNLLREDNFNREYLTHCEDIVRLRP